MRRACILLIAGFTASTAFVCRTAAQHAQVVATRTSAIGAAVSMPAEMQDDSVFLAELGRVQPALQVACFEGKGASVESLLTPDSSRATALEYVYDAEHKPPPAQLTALRKGWMATPVRLRQKAICQYMFWSDVLDALVPVIDSGWALPVVERYLEQVTDSNRVPMSLVISGLVAESPDARRVAAAAHAMGDPRRYDAIIENAGFDSHTQTYGYRNIKARALTLLGRAYLADAKLKPAAQTLAYARALVPTSDPTLGARIALQAHDTVTAVREAALCRLVVSCVNADDAGTQTLLEDLYRTVNHGSLEGIDTLLLMEYRQPVFDLPITIAAWSRPVPVALDAPRHRALLQFETLIHCTPCAAHDWAARGLERRFGGDVITLAYAYYPPLTSPGYRITDGFSKPGADASSLNAWYEHMGSTSVNYDAKAGPTHWNGMVVDGAGVQTPSNIEIEGGRDAAVLRYDEVARTLEQHLLPPPHVHLTLDGRIEGDRVVAEAAVAPVDGAAVIGTDRRLKLQVVLVEDSVLVTGANSPVQRHLVRAIAGDSASDFGLPLAMPLAGSVRTTAFDIPAIEAAIRRRTKEAEADDAGGLHEPDWVTRRAFHIDHRHLSVVAFVQDQAGGEVLDAVQVNLAPTQTGLRTSR